jgi:hypothetical protein
VEQLLLYHFTEWQCRKFFFSFRLSLAETTTRLDVTSCKPVQSLRVHPFQSRRFFVNASPWHQLRRGSTKQKEENNTFSPSSSHRHKPELSASLSLTLTPTLSLCLSLSLFLFLCHVTKTA